MKLTNLFLLPPNGISLEGYIKKYDLKNYIEIGMNIGENIEYVIEKFNRLVLLSNHPIYIQQAIRKYGKLKKIDILENDDPEDLRSLFKYFRITSPTMFVINKELTDEINVICSEKETDNDVFIIEKYEEDIGLGKLSKTHDLSGNIITPRKR